MLINNFSAKKSLRGYNHFSVRPEWIELPLPDTTLIISTPDNISSTDVVQTVCGILGDNLIDVDKVYSAQISIADYFLYKN